MTAPSPAPYPSTGGAAGSWSCTDRVGASPSPTTSPSPVPPLGQPSPVPSTVTVWGRLGQDCAVTDWGVDPVPVVTVQATVAAEPASTTAGVDRLANYVPGAAALMVFLLAALLVVQLRRHG